MNIDKKIEELRKEFNEKIDELKEEYELEKNGKWMLRLGTEYYYLSESLVVMYDTFSDEPYQNELIKYNRIFKTAEQAHDYADYLKARKEYSYEFSKEEWENDSIHKYHIYCDFDDKSLYVGSINFFGRIGGIYFKTKEKAQEFIDKYKKQILKFEFGIEEE